MRDPGQKPVSAAALRYATEILKFYNQYYGIPYPFGKLDILGLPDFEAGAWRIQERFSIVNRCFFIDDKNSSVDSHQAVFEVLAHEMAHQGRRSGNDEVVGQHLAERRVCHMDGAQAIAGVASGMECDAGCRAGHGLGPYAGRAWSNTLPSAQGKTLLKRSMSSLIPFLMKRPRPCCAWWRFYVSPDVFRRGVNVYLRRFLYGNATAEDFWTALSAASWRPVDKIMPTFVDQAGEPLLTVKSACLNPSAQKAPVVRKGKQ